MQFSLVFCPPGWVEKNWMKLVSLTDNRLELGPKMFTTMGTFFVVKVVFSNIIELTLCTKKMLVDGIGSSF